MSGPERRYINKVHGGLQPEWKVYKQGNTGVMGVNGTPDYYYEGFKTATWIEYKYVQKIPQRFLITDAACRFKLSPLQRAWLNRAYNNQVRVAVVLGSEEGALIIAQGRWEEYISLNDNRIANKIVTPGEVAYFTAGFGDNRVAI